MAAVVGIAKGATEIILGIGDVSIDNFTFKLFYKWSVTFYITCSVAVSANQLFGDPIACEAVRHDNWDMCAHAQMGQKLLIRLHTV